MPGTTRPLRVLLCLAVAGVSVFSTAETRLPEERPAPGGWVDLVEAFELDPPPADTQRLDFGTEAARVAMGRGWDRASERGNGAPFSWAVGLRSELRLHAGPPADRALVAEVRPFEAAGAQPQRIELRLNGRSLGTRGLSAERQQLRWDAPRDAWREGVNDLEALYARTRSLSDVAPGRDTRELSVAWFALRVEGPTFPEPRIVSVHGADALRIPIGRPVGFHVEAGEIVELRWGGVGEPGAAGQLRLRATSCVDGKPCEPPVETAVRGGPQRLALPGTPGPRRVSLRCLQVDDGLTALDGIALIDPELGPVETTRRAVESGPVPPHSPEMLQRPNVIVYLVDTLRADRLGAYGYHRPTTPRLDALARQSFVFDRAYANAPWTLPAVASVFTGTYPWTHGVDGRRHRVGGPASAFDPEIVTLAQSLSASGYESAAFFANRLIAGETGLGAGFSVYRYVPGRPKSEAINARADVLNREALSWMDARHRQSPFFLYVHAMDPHAPYTPPPDQRRRFAPSVPAGDVGSIGFIERLQSAPRADDGDFAAAMSDLYDGEVAYADEALGDLLDELERRDLMRNTLLVVLADHGEALFEHGVWGHLWWLYEEVVRIPLIIRQPGPYSRSGRSAEVVQQVDILPTLLDLVGVPAPPMVQGRSLVPILQGGFLPPRPAYAGVAMDGRVSWLEVEGARKTIVHQCNATADEGRNGIDLFDLVSDPREALDRTLSFPVAAGVARLRLLTEIKRHHRTTPVEGSAPDLKALRSLGYVR